MTSITRLLLFLTLILTLFLYSHKVQGQNKIRTKQNSETIKSKIYDLSNYDYVKLNTLYFELGGPGALYSLNYERRFPFSKKSINKGISVAIGGAFIPINTFGIELNAYAIPAQVTYTYQNYRNRFDIGIATTFYNRKNFNSTSDHIAHLLILRYLKSIVKNDNFEWGLTLSPIIRDRGKFNFQPWGGIRFGYKFESAH